MQVGSGTGNFRAGLGRRLPGQRCGRMPAAFDRGRSDHGRSILNKPSSHAVELRTYGERPTRPGFWPTRQLQERPASQDWGSLSIGGSLIFAVSVGTYLCTYRVLLEGWKNMKYRVPLSPTLSTAWFRIFATESSFRDTTRQW